MVDRLRVAVVTGANSHGIGRETARELAGRGFHVVLACRNLDEARVAANDIKATVAGASVEVGPALDLSKNSSIREFANKLLAKHPRINVLVNNAGINFRPAWNTDEGIVGMVQVNYLGPFLLTRLLEKQLAMHSARVVNVSSVMHRRTTFCKAEDFLRDAEEGTYARTKLANAMFTAEMNRRAKGRLTCVAVDPGAVSTALFRHAGFPSIVKGFMSVVFGAPREGCQAVVHAATCTIPPMSAAPKSSDDVLPFYARGFFASCAMSMVQPLNGLGLCLVPLRELAFAVCALLDQPCRTLSGGKLASESRAVRAAPAALDIQSARELWDVSSELCGLPTDVQLA